MCLCLCAFEEGGDRNARLRVRGAVRVRVSVRVYVGPNSCVSRGNGCLRYVCVCVCVCVCVTDSVCKCVSV